MPTILRSGLQSQSFHVLKFFSACKSPLNFTEATTADYCTTNGAGPKDQYCHPFDEKNLPPATNQFIEAFPNLSFIRLLDLQAAPAPSNILYAVTRTGQIFAFENDRNVQ